MRKPIRVQVKGKQYRFASLQAAADHFKIPLIPMQARLRLGWKLSKALGTPLRYYKPRKYVPSADTIAYQLRHMPKASDTIN